MPVRATLPCTGMNAYLFLKSLLTTATFLPRHLFFIATGTLFAWVVWTALYLFLLAIALLGHGQLGDPLAYPTGLLVILATGLIGGGGIGLPACAFGYWTCRSYRWPKAAAIPVVLLAGALEATPVIAGLFRVKAGLPLVDLAIWSFFTYLWAIAPLLGLYWWLTESPRPIFEGLRRRILRKYFTGSPGNAEE
ncbi:MAG: hypothetical protein JWO82_2004 [Akkermansiaceae bacterium]|nr:hypothetical protein [Akkermansiaceae bacterium]